MGRAALHRRSHAARSSGQYRSHERWCGRHTQCGQCGGIAVNAPRQRRTPFYAPAPERHLGATGRGSPHGDLHRRRIPPPVIFLAGRLARERIVAIDPSHRCCTAGWPGARNLSAGRIGSGTPRRPQHPAGWGNPAGRLVAFPERGHLEPVAGDGAEPRRRCEGCHDQPRGRRARAGPAAGVGGERASGPGPVHIARRARLRARNVHGWTFGSFRDKCGRRRRRGRFNSWVMGNMDTGFAKT